MLRTEIFRAAIVLTIIWLSTLAYAITEGGHPPTGIVLIVVTIVAAAGWFAVWDLRVRGQLREVQREMNHLQEQRDVEEAMRRLAPHMRSHLRVVSRDDLRGRSHG